MEYMHELKEKLCEELEEIAMKPEMSAGDLETAHKLSDTIKNLLTVDAMDEDDGYSRAGKRTRDTRGFYDDGASYMPRRRDSMGRFSRDGRGRYSRAEAKDDMIEQIEDMLGDASGREKEILRRAMEQLEKI